MNCAKVPYDSEHAAKEAKVRIERNHSKMRAYLCDLCWKWHLTKHIHTDGVQAKIDKMGKHHGDD